MRDIKSLTLEELTAYFKKINQPGYYAKGIWSWIYQKNATDFSLMSNLPLDLRCKLAEDFCISSLKIEDKLVSKDGTQKYLFALDDKKVIESVFIPHRDRNTVCLSTQAGCKYACRFCSSGKNGFERNLTHIEIVNQLLKIKGDTKRPITYVVFMGIGEPLDNYEELLKAIRIINSKDAINIGQRRITISSAGLVAGIRQLSREGLQVELSISLHSSDNEKRNSLMPINKKYPLEELIRAVEEFIRLTKRKVTFEYVLLGGFNTEREDALKLVKLIRGLNCKVNLIPFNAAQEEGAGVWERPAKLEVLFFQDLLLKNKIEVTLRQARGQDIEAACGQLRLRHEREKL